MTADRSRGGAWPTPTQELLLRAALERGRAANEHWQAWKQVSDLSHLDTSSERLLPLVYRNLSGQGSSDPVVESLKGLYRATWFKNQLLFGRAAAVLGGMKARDIPTVVFKGAPLAVDYYRDLGVRPMSDVDVLVPRRDALRCVTHLVDAGWRPVDYPWTKGLSSRAYYQARSSLNLVDSDGFEVDLHWSSFSLWPAMTDEEEVWSAARPFRLQGVETLALTPTDLLLMVCVHGARWHPTPLLRWIADAATLLRESGSEIDPDRLVRLALKHEVVTPLRVALRYLQDRRFADVPEVWLKALEGVKASRTDGLRHGALAHFPGPIGIAVKFWYWYLGYRRLRGGPSFLGLPIDVFEFLRYRWGLESVWRIPASGVERALIRLRRLGGWTSP